MGYAIEVDSVCKFYRDNRFRVQHALRNVSLVVEEGESFGFIGPNGAGKSSTIKILVGVSQPSTGSAFLFGRNVAEAAARVGVAYVPENASLYDYLTPYEILKMGVRSHRVSVPNIRQHCMYWLERFRVGHVADKPIRQFSKGMVQRTALAHALACKPRLLILDEPLSGLDPVGRKEVVDILVEYRQSGGSTFFSSHVLHDVERMADRFGLIHQGCLRTVQHPEELVGGESRLVVRTMGTAVVDGMNQDAQGRWYGEVSSMNLWDLLHRVQLAGHSLIEVKPSMTLEQAFLKYVTSEDGEGRNQDSQLES